MSVFRKIRIYPSHGSRSAVITWELAPGVKAGSVYAAFSMTGLPETWVAVNAATPVASAVGMLHDTSCVVNGAASTGYYRLLLRNTAGDFTSESVGLIGDLTRQEFGMIRAMIHREYLEMRVNNGYPVWHCIPKDHGVPATDPDTGEKLGVACGDPETSGFGMKFVGGFNVPVLTWVRPIKVSSNSLVDSEDGTTVLQQATSAMRMMAFPSPSRGHMLVDPTTDTRYLIGDTITPFALRGVMPYAYEVSVDELVQNDVRYKFVVPAIDTKAYRRLPYWAP